MRLATVSGIVTGDAPVSCVIGTLKELCHEIQPN